MLDHDHEFRRDRDHFLFFLFDIYIYQFLYLFTSSEWSPGEGHIKPGMTTDSKCHRTSSTAEISQVRFDERCRRSLTTEVPNHVKMLSGVLEARNCRLSNLGPGNFSPCCFLQSSFAPFLTLPITSPFSVPLHILSYAMKAHASCS